jgi:hypothetical protein
MPLLIGLKGAIKGPQMKELINGSKGSFDAETGNGSLMTHNAHKWLTPLRSVYDSIMPHMPDAIEAAVENRT